MKIGFIGLGITGRPMAKNLLKADYGLVVNNFNKDAVADVAPCGTMAASSGAEAASQCEVIVTMVSSSSHVRAAVLGEGDIVKGTRPGMVLIDMSSTDPTESKATGAELAKKDIEMMDCLVSGGGPKVIDGTLSAMCGGRKELLDKYYDMLMVVAGSAVCVGELGSGNVVKPTDQIVVTVNIAAVPEALIPAKKTGTNPELVYQAIRGGLADSTVTDAKVPMILTGSFKSDFRIELHIRDLSNALNTTHAISLPVPPTERLMEIMQGLKADGLEKEDHFSIVKYYEKTTSTTVES